MANKQRLIDANALSEKIGIMKFEITRNRGGYRYCNEEEKNEWDKLDSFDSLVCDAPTVDAEPVVYGRWVSMGAYQGHKCGVCNDYYTDDAVNLFYCPRCGAKMVEIEKLDYRRKDMPIGAPWKKTVCEHGRSEDVGKTD